jgi:mycothiol synthase
VDLHRAAFGTDQMTKEFRQSIMASPDYDPQLDLVVQSLEGELAAFCVCQISQNDIAASEDAIGWTDPIGVHPNYRGRGFAKSLIQEGLTQLKARGMEFARLGTRSDNFAMLGLAKLMGYKEINRRLWFSKKIG